MGLFTLPSARNAIHARPLAPKFWAMPGSLSSSPRLQVPAPLALMHLTTWPSVLAAWANTLNCDPLKTSLTSMRCMPKRVSGLSLP